MCWYVSYIEQSVLVFFSTFSIATNILLNVVIAVVNVPVSCGPCAVFDINFLLLSI